VSKIELTTVDEFKDAIREGVTLVDFNAPWCAPCRAQEPIIERLSDQFEGKALIAAINIDGQRELAGNLGIRGIPTLILYRDNEEIHRFVGLQQEPSLVESIERALKMP
jgi:thioredoxin 1